MLIGDLAAEFVEEREWPTRDRAGRPQRVVVERVDPDNPEHTERCRPDWTLEEAGVRDNDTLRILPESIAGLYHPRERLQALVLAYREVRALAEDDPTITIADQDSDHNPTRYELAFHVAGVKEGPHGLEITHDHRAEIILPADYPLAAPWVRWLTPIFHPNIHPRGGVCLGVLRERYTPGVGLAYLVRMLRDIVQYRNYDLEGVLNGEAARWAQSEEGQQMIVETLKGVPAEHLLGIAADQEQRAARGQRVRFTPWNRFQQEGEE
jgi:ubiquitin-protein ligase